jgi:thymidylate kinase
MAERSANVAAWALEGLPFAGKSTSGRFVAERNPDTLLLADYHDLLGAGSASYAGVPGSAAEQEQRIETYLTLDRARWKQVSESTRRPVVLDRCHISLMAYAIALSPWIGAEACHASLARIRAALAEEAHPLREPAGIIYLQMDAQTAATRCVALATTIGVALRTEQFAQQLIDAYEQVLASCGAEVVRCSSEQPLKGMHEQVAAVLGERAT